MTDFRSRLGVEPLEDRTVPNSRFVVPFDLPADGKASFYTLQAALTTPGLTAGDVVQIEPRAFPGAIADADLPNVANLTVRGNPGVGAAETPAVYVTDRLIVTAARAGFALRDATLVLHNGPIEFRAAGTVSTSTVTSVSSNGTAAIELTDAKGVVLDRNVVTATGALSAVVRVDPRSGSDNVLVGNRLVANPRSPNTAQRALQYTESGSSGVSLADTVEGNTLVALGGSNAAPLLEIGPGVSGLIVRGNTFRDLLQQKRTAVAVGTGTGPFGGDQMVTLVENTFQGVGVGVDVDDGTNETTTAVVERNTFDTRPVGSPFARGAWGIGLDVSADNDQVRVKVEGNDFQYTRIGVRLTGEGSLLTADLGGGSLGARGGNSFRGFTAQATDTQAAIINTSSMSFQSPVINAAAQNNSFSVADPLTVIIRLTVTNQGGTTPNTTASALATNQAYVQSLYIRLLGRLGDVFNPADAGSWVNRLGSGTPAVDVVYGIFRSPEAIGVEVDRLYKKHLSRAADAGGKAFFTQSVATGMTFDVVIARLVSSGEYRSRVAGSDTAFVQSMYVGLLGRPGSEAEVQGWMGTLAAGGRAAVTAGFLASPEYRSLTVRGYYLLLLRRATQPTAGEISGWADLPANLSDIYVGFLASGEYRTNG